MFQLYLVTDEETADPAPLARALYELDRGLAPTHPVARALAALPRGMAAVQLRAKRFEAARLLAAAHALRRLTRAYGAQLLVNDRVDVALIAGADGVHLPSAGVPPEVAREIGRGLLVGASTHGEDEARRAVTAGADFVTFGPVFATPSKAGFGEPLGLGALARAVARLGAPIFALGGVDAGRARECAATGAGVACLRGVLGAGDPAAAAIAYRDAIDGAARART